MFDYPQRAFQIVLPRVQLRRGQWLALLFALMFSGVSATAWANTQQIVIWLMSQGMVEEANAGAVSDGIRQVALGASLAALAAVLFIAARGTFGIYPWTPLLPLVRYLKKSLHVVMGVATYGIRAVATASSALATSVAYYFSMVTTPIIRRLQAILHSTLVHALKGSALAGGWVRASWSVSIRRLSETFLWGWTVISIPLGYASKVAAVVLGRLSAGIYGALRYVGRLLSIVARVTGAARDLVVAVLGRIRVGVYAALRYVGWLLSTVARVADKVLDLLITVLGRIRTGCYVALRYVGRLLSIVARVTGAARDLVVAVLGRIRVGVYAALRYVGWLLSIVARVTGAARDLVVAVLGRIRVGVYAALRYVGRLLSTVARVADKVLDLLITVLSRIRTGGYVALRYVGRLVYIVARVASAARDPLTGVLGSLWRAVSTLVMGVALTSGYLRGPTGAAFRHLSTVLQASRRVTRRATATAVRPILHWVHKAATTAALTARTAVNGITTGLGSLMAGVSAVVRLLGLLAAYWIRTAAGAAVLVASVGLSGFGTGLGSLQASISTLIKPVILLTLYWMVAAATTIVLAVSTGLTGLAAGLWLLLAAVTYVARPLGRLVLFSAAAAFTGAFLAGRALIIALGPVWTGAVCGMGSIHGSLTTSLVLFISLAESVGRSVAYAGRLMLQALFRPVLFASRQLWMGASTIALLLGWLIRAARRQGLAVLRGTSGTVVLLATMMWTGVGTAPEVGRTVWQLATDRKGVFAMSDNNLTRQRVLSLIGTLWVLGWTFWPAPPEPTVEVEHWATGHLMREGDGIRLLPVMAEEFNRAGHRTKAGTRIVIKVHNVPSELIAKYLSARVTSGHRINLTERTDGYVRPGYSDPMIVTPSSAHWLVTVNHESGRTVVDLGAAQSLVRPVIGIVTYTEMARCLGWPQKQIGYADILALRADPRGWSKYPCASPKWGQKPLIAFTDPTTSSTGRSLLLGLYSVAAGVPPEQLTLNDVNDPAVAGYVKQFQGLVDHYLIGTTVLNTKIHQGPRYGHFFIMPEDNLIYLYEGTERAFINGVRVKAPPIEPGSMVMVYPVEGSMPRSNCTCIVQAD